MPIEFCSDSKAYAVPFVLFTLSLILEAGFWFVLYYCHSAQNRSRIKLLPLPMVLISFVWVQLVHQITDQVFLQIRDHPASHKSLGKVLFRVTGLC